MGDHVLNHLDGVAELVEEVFVVLVLVALVLVVLVLVEVVVEWTEQPFGCSPVVEAYSHG